MWVVSLNLAILFLVTENLWVASVLFLTDGSSWRAKIVAPGSLCLSITSSVADLTLAFFSLTRGMDAAGFPQESRVVEGNECRSLAFFLMGTILVFSIFHSALLSSGLPRANSKRCSVFQRWGACGLLASCPFLLRMLPCHFASG